MDRLSDENAAVTKNKDYFLYQKYFVMQPVRLTEVYITEVHTNIWVKQSRVANKDVLSNRKSEHADQCALWFEDQKWVTFRCVKEMLAAQKMFSVQQSKMSLIPRNQKRLAIYLVDPTIWARLKGFEMYIIIFYLGD